MRAAYEVSNPSFKDLSLEEQIEQGITDWCAEDEAGREFYGRTRDEAETARVMYASHRAPRGQGTHLVDPNAPSQRLND